ncbi:MAG TPA: hypothetical protein VF588_22605 [Pyrinomonadaceae bacterium]|jgi:hypothetical protein
MRTIILSAIIILSASGAWARQDEPRRFLDPSLVPAEGLKPADFVPRGWKTETDEAVVTGDLNRDGAADAVVRLVEDMPLQNSEGVYNTRYRALVVLFAKPGGGYMRAAVATKLLGCSLCFGVLGDPEGGNIQVEIEKGVLNVSQLSGSREARDHTLRFRHDAASGRFQLIGEELSEYDRLEANGTSTSTNYLTGVRVFKTSRTLRGGRESTSTKTTRVPRASRFIEDVDYEKQ